MTTEKTPKPVIPVADKIAALESQKATINTQLETAPEDQKAGLQEQVADIDRKIRWYQGRQKSAKFQAKEATAPATPAAPETVSDPREG